MFKFLRDESGATAIEYALIAAAMGVGLVLIMPQLSDVMVAKFGSLASHISTGT